MDRLIKVRESIVKMRELKDIMNALRALAGARVTRAKDSAVSMKAYSTICTDALSSALALLPEPPTQQFEGDRLVLAIGSEHGFVGGLNRQVLAEIQRLLDTGDQLMILGTRLSRLATESSIESIHVAPLPTRVGSIEQTAIELVIRISETLARYNLHRVELILCTDPATGTINHRSLLPIDFSGLEISTNELETPPLCHLEASLLVAKFSEEYFIAALAFAILEAFTSESRARLLVTHRAHDNIAHKLQMLSDQENLMRQEAITTEIADVIAGSTESRKSPS